MMRHLALFARDFFHRFARVRRDHLMQVEHEIGAANERLRQIHRVIHHGHDHEMILVPDPMFGDRRAVAAGNAVAPDPADLQMRGGDGQDVAVPFPGRESLPGVRSILGWMRPAVHIDGALRRLPGNVGVPRHDLLRRRVHFFRDAQIRRPADAVIGRVRLALMLREREQVGIPDVAAHASRVVDRQPQIVADLGAGNALRLVLMKERIPLARQIDLRERRNSQRRCEHK